MGRRPRDQELLEAQRKLVWVEVGRARGVKMSFLSARQSLDRQREGLFPQLRNDQPTGSLALDAIDGDLSPGFEPETHLVSLRERELRPQLKPPRLLEKRLEFLVVGRASRQTAHDVEVEVREPSGPLGLLLP